MHVSREKIVPLQGTPVYIGQTLLDVPATSLAAVQSWIDPRSGGIRERKRAFGRWSYDTDRREKRTVWFPVANAFSLLVSTIAPMQNNGTNQGDLRLRQVAL
jgi:hypothetical protein